MTKSATNKKWISNRAYDIGWTRIFKRKEETDKVIDEFSIIANIQDGTMLQRMILHHHLPEEMPHQNPDREGNDGIPPSQGPDPDGDSAVVAPLEQGEDIINDQSRDR